MNRVAASTAMISATLLSMCALLFLVLAVQIRTPPPASSASVAPSLQPIEIDAFAPTANAEFVMAQRPLFHSERRTFADEPDFISTTDASNPSTSPDTAYRLRGVVIAGAESRAAFQPISGGPPFWLAHGETLSGWEIVRVIPDRVTLALGDDRTTLALYPDTQGAP